MTNSEMKALLLVRVDAAILQAPDVKIPYYSDAVENFVRRVKGSGHSLKRWEHINANEWDRYINNLSSYERLLKEIVRFEIKKNEIVKKFLIKSGLEYVTFKIPNATNFRVLNVKSHLVEFKKKVLKNHGFKNPKKSTVKKYSNSTPLTVLKNFLKDDELENLIEAAHLANVKIGFDDNKNVYLDCKSVDVGLNRECFDGLNEKNRFIVVDSQTGMVIFNYKSENDKQHRSIDAVVKLTKSKLKALSPSQISNAFNNAKYNQGQEYLKSLLLGVL